jgi:putative FmdB family regulatory protein
MPIYEYECGRCGQVFEVRQRMSDKPLTNHTGPNDDPNFCNGSVERRVSASSLKFNGSGFYETDYKQKRPRGTSS